MPSIYKTDFSDTWTMYLLLRGLVPLLFRLFQFQIYTMAQKKANFSYIIFLNFLVNQGVKSLFQMRISLMFQCSAFFRKGGSSQKKKILFQESEKRRQGQKGNHTLLFLRNIGTVYYFLYIYIFIYLNKSTTYNAPKTKNSPDF